jgi:hypothetical protein
VHGDGASMCQTITKFMPMSEEIRSVTQIISDNYTLYTLDGAISGVEGTYEVGVNSVGEIVHYFFRPIL